MPQPLPAPLHAQVETINPGAIPVPLESLESLEVLALTNNPTLRRMQHEAAAEWAQTGYVSKLPDPTISSMFYLPPMNYEPDRLVAELQVMQMIPWVERLKAEARQAHLEALAAENEYLSERLRVVAEVRMNWYRLYVLGKQIETTEADQAQLESLIKTANARIATGDAQPGDVLMGTLELSSLQEQLLTYRQEMVSTAAELNRIAGRDARVPIEPPKELAAELPRWDHDLLRGIAMNAQPELNAARLTNGGDAVGHRSRPAQATARRVDQRRLDGDGRARGDDARCRSRFMDAGFLNQLADQSPQVRCDARRGVPRTFRGARFGRRGLAAAGCNATRPVGTGRGRPAND